MDIFASKIIKNAYNSGIKLFDSGRIYGYSEKFIGNALNGINRETFSIVTKVSDMDIERSVSPNTVEGNLADSLRYLRSDYVDCYLLHWAHGNWVNIYLDMEKMYKSGKAKSLGVCNFAISDFEILAKRCTVWPHVCQTELHPFNSKPQLQLYCREHSIALMAHTPTGRMCEKIVNNEVLRSIAQKYNKTIAQIIIRWHVQNQIIPIIATVSKNHMVENLNIFDFELSTNDMANIQSLDENYVILKSNGIDNPKYIYNL